MLVEAIFIAVMLCYVGTGAAALIAARAARRATARADQAIAEAAIAAKEAYQARADLHKVTRLLLAEVKRAEDARRKLPVVPAVLPAFRERDLMEPHPAPIGGLKPLVDAFVDHEAAIAAGEPRSNFLFSTSGVVIGRKSPERIRWEAGEDVPGFPEHSKGQRVTPFPVLADGTQSLVQLAGACGQYTSGMPIAFGQVEQIITQFYEGRG